MNGIDTLSTRNHTSSCTTTYTVDHYDMLPTQGRMMHHPNSTTPRLPPDPSPQRATGFYAHHPYSSHAQPSRLEEIYPAPPFYHSLSPKVSYCTGPQSVLIPSSETEYPLFSSSFRIPPPLPCTPLPALSIFIHSLSRSFLLIDTRSMSTPLCLKAFTTISRVYFSLLPRLTYPQPSRQLL